MKCKILPMIHKYQLRQINPNRYPWGWRSQKEIRKLLTNTSNLMYQPNLFDENINKKTKFYEKDVEYGTLIGYKRVYESFYKKENFINKSYTTPELSFAINRIIKSKSKFNVINIDNIKSKVLTSWIEIGHATSNSKILGILDKKVIKKEISNSNISDCWDVYVGPLKQKVKILYISKNRLDIWEWERCLMIEDSDWNISNINNILI